jgi:hypothetical protein
VKDFAVTFVGSSGPTKVSYLLSKFCQQKFVSQIGQNR